MNRKTLFLTSLVLIGLVYAPLATADNADTATYQVSAQDDSKRNGTELGNPPKQERRDDTARQGGGKESGGRDGGTTIKRKGDGTEVANGRRGK